MAGLEVRKGRYNLILRYGNKRFVRSLKTTDEDEALSKKLRVEENIRLVESGRLTIPEGADVVTFLLSDGRLDRKPVVKASLTIPELFSAFWDAMPGGSLEPSTICTMEIHQRHLERLLGKRIFAQELTQADLQKFVTDRSKEKTAKGTSISGGTIKKEIVTLNSVWRWGVNAKKLNGALPKNDLRYPKSSEPPIFQTWQEIERQISGGAPEELWDALYLNMDEIKKLLEYVTANARFPFISPMFAFAAYTGARRSELMRSRVTDIDFDGGTITIREKKRVKGKLSMRRVPISQSLEVPLREWLAQHPGTAFTFFHVDTNRRSKEDARQLTRKQMSHHFRHVLHDSDWNVIKGWHCLRHSFISNCASKGIDQRMIDEWVGHTTDSMRRRYRHLFPSSQQDAMDTLFS